MKKLYPLQRRGRWILLCLFFLALTSHARSLRDSTNITLHLINQPIEAAFKLIEKQTGLTFFYGIDILNGKSLVTVNIKNATLSEALNVLLKDKNTTWTLRGNGIILRKIASSSSNSTVINIDSLPLINIKGVVVNDKGVPIEAVTVSIKGQSRGQGTDNQGRFEFIRVPSNGILVFSSIGFDSKQMKINGRNEIRIVLDSSIREIEAVEVVSTGYQKIPKERATGSFVQLNNKLYNEQVGTNVLQRIPSIASSVQALPGKLTNNQFALTIRGISTVRANQSPLIILNNFPYEGDINNINPNDVESITILRDAAASSIWGARAGNGVIVINTKKSTFNTQTKLDITSNITLSEEPDLGYLQGMSTSDAIDVEKFLFGNGYYDYFLDYVPNYFLTKVVTTLDQIKKGEISEAEGNALIDGFRSRDIRDEYKKYIYEKGFNQQYALNLRGGGNNIAWMISAGFDQNKSELQAKFKRYNFRIENTFRPLKNLQMDLGLTYSQTNSISGAEGYNSLPTTMETPYTLFKDEMGNPLAYYAFREAYLDTLGQGKLLDWGYYPTEDFKHNRTNNEVQNFLGRLNVKYNLNKFLSFEVNYQLEKQNNWRDQLAGLQSYEARDYINLFSNIDYETGQVTRVVPSGGILNKTVGKVTSQGIRGQVNVDHSFGDNSITGFVGGEVRDISRETVNNTLFGYNPELRTSIPVDISREYPFVDPNLGSSQLPANNLMTLFQERYVSVFANVLYSYRQKYSISGSARRDASNIFGVSSNQKWNPLWSVGAGWNISNEGFYKSGFVPLLKLRGTYGASGNILQNASSVTTISYGTPSIHTLTPRANTFGYSNKDLRWEKVKMLNIGIDFGLKNNTLSGSIEYFSKKAVDLFGYQSYDRTLGLGVSQILKNNGTLKGNGIDLILNSVNINRRLKWTTNLLLSYYSDKITDFYITEEAFASDYINGFNATKGYTRYPIFSFKFAGLDPTTGDPQGIINGKPSTNYLALYGDSTRVQDLNYHGSAVPKYFGSIGNTFTYGKFNLTFRIRYQFGHFFRRNSVDYFSMFAYGKGHSDYSKRWQKPGDELVTTVPSLPYPANDVRDFFYANSEPLVSKAGNIRMDYINLSYNVIQKKTGNLPISGLRVSLIANNVGLLWKANKFGIDPLYVDDQLPPTRNYTASVNVQF